MNFLKWKQIEIKSRTCYFYNDIINIEEFDSNVLKIDKSITKGFVFTAMDTLQ